MKAGQLAALAELVRIVGALDEEAYPDLCLHVTSYGRWEIQVADTRMPEPDRWQVVTEIGSIAKLPAPVVWRGGEATYLSAEDSGGYVWTRVADPDR